MKTFALLAVVAAALLSACATPYQSRSLLGGFSETQLAPDVFRINFRGNGYSSPERAQDFALLRAAELTLQNGYSFFTVAGSSDTVSRSVHTDPGQSHTTGSVNAYGGTVTYTGQTIYTPGETSVTSKPRSNLVIHCLREKPSNAFAFDARFLQTSLRQKYRMQ